MFIISLTYKTSLEKIEHFLSEHNAFLQRYYDEGKFIASGRKEPRTGGIILSNAVSKIEIEQIIKEDPFFIHDIANYDVTEFIPSKYHENFNFFINY